MDSATIHVDSEIKAHEVSYITIQPSLLWAAEILHRQLAIQNDGGGAGMLLLGNIPQAIWIGPFVTLYERQIAEGEEKSAAGADLFCLPKVICPRRPTCDELPSLPPTLYL